MIHSSRKFCHADPWLILTGSSSEVQLHVSLPRHSPSLSGRGKHQELCQLSTPSLAEFASVGLSLRNMTLNLVPTCAELLTRLAAVLLQVCELPAPGLGWTRGSSDTCTTCTKLSIQLVPSLLTNLLSTLPFIPTDLAGETIPLLSGIWSISRAKADTGSTGAPFGIMLIRSPAR